MIKFLIALSPFTEENGGIRVTPGSNKWEDFRNLGCPEDIISCEMEAVDALLINGKVVHGGGANRTADERRRAVSSSFQCSFPTPEAAYPFIVSLDLVKHMSSRA